MMKQTTFEVFLQKNRTILWILFAVLILGLIGAMSITPSDDMKLHWGEIQPLAEDWALEEPDGNVSAITLPAMISVNPRRYDSNKQGIIV